MSNSLSIAAVTAALRDLLGHVAAPRPGETDTDLSDTQVTTLPLDRAGQQDDRNQLNLFLALTIPNGSLRNLDPLRRGRPDVTGPPPLALELIYLITAFGRHGDELLSHRLLGRAMSLFHASPTLLPEQQKLAQPGSDIQRPEGFVRLTPYRLPIEELSKLWGLFQTKYRLTAAYQAAVILIDAPTMPAAAPVTTTSVRVLRKPEDCKPS